MATMASACDDNDSQPKSLVRRFSVGSKLSPSRSAGTESATKARQLRHAATFSLQYNDPDTTDGSLAVLLRRHLRSPSGSSESTAANDATPPPPIAGAPEVASPTTKRLSAKMERALNLRNQCERNLTKYFEAKHLAPHGTSPKSSPCRADLLDKSYWFDPENVHDNHARDKRTFDRLMRKLSPAMRNAATTHSDLVHSIQSCSECATRSTFCSRCARKASEFFENYTETELQTLYCRELPPPDTKALAAFEEAMAEREFRVTH